MVLPLWLHFSTAYCLLGRVLGAFPWQMAYHLPCPWACREEA